MESKGEKIKGSKYLRDFCMYCDEPIRVTVPGFNVCDYCSGIDHGTNYIHARSTKFMRSANQGAKMKDIRGIR